MSMFGTSYPAISSNLLTASIAFSTEIYVRDNPEFDRNTLINQSKLTGKKHIHHRGNHQRFTLNIISGITRAKLLNLLTIEGTEVDYIPYIDNPGRIIPCYLKEVTPYHLNNINSCDAVKIVMETTEFWKDNSGTLLDTTGSTPIDTDADVYWVDENGDHIIDENGNKLILSGGNE